MICVCKVFRYTAKELDEACTIADVSCVRLYYYGARYLDAKYSRWLSTDPAVGEYIPQAPVNDEARKHNQSLPGMGGVYNVVNFQLYHYAGNTPVKYTDPDGKIILNIIEKFNMSIKPLRDINLGNSRSKTFGQTGCYVTTFANIFVSSKYYGLPLANADKYDTPIKINNNKDLFLKDSDWIKGREVSMDELFGKGKWDYWTKDKQGADGLADKIDEYSRSDKVYMIVGIFNLSSDTPDVTNHMVGLSGGPDANGVFHHMTPTSNGDKNRGINIRENNAYNINNLKEIRVILLEDWMIRNVILLNILLVCSLYSADLSVVMNFDCMKFEICQDNKIIIKSLSFNDFYGYQIVMDKVYFIDCSDSNITEYGVVCYFDLKTQNMIYTSIKSGSAFYITNDEKIILVSSLFAVKNDSAIEDDFGIKNTIIEYALNVDLYDLEKQTLIKHFDFQNFFNTNMIRDTYVNFQKDDRGNIKIIYRILDTTQEIIPGYIDLTKYIFCQYSSSSSIATNKRNGAG